MKKIFIILVLFFLFINISVANPLNIGLYGQNKYATGEMSEFVFCSIGGGIVGRWEIPIVPILGLSSRFEFEGMILENDVIETWWNTNILIGLCINLPLSCLFSVTPEIDYGLNVNILDVESLEKIYIDSLFQVSFGLYVRPMFLEKRNLAIEIAPLYTLVMESDTASNLFGFRLGLAYNLEEEIK